MKFIVSSQLLYKHVNYVSRVVPSRPVLPILEYFLFELNQGQLTITATDLEVTMTTSLPVESQDQGKIAVKAKILTETLSKLPEQPITIKFDEETRAIEINSDSGKYKQVGENPNDYPQPHTVDKGIQVQMPAALLLKGISSTLFAVSKDDMRPAMMGVLFHFTPQGLNFVATDAHCLAKYAFSDITTPEEYRIIIPEKALTILQRVLQSSENNIVTIEFNQSSAAFYLDGTRMNCRLIEERFPDYQNVIPVDSPNQVIVNTDSFIKALKLVSLYSNAHTHQIRLKIQGNMLTLNAEDLEFANEASEYIPCGHEGEDMEIGFNANMLLNVVSNIPSKETTFMMSTPNRACLVVPTENDANESLIMLIMPVMLSSPSYS
ncbi:MAG: DNA polymerase III subunit beta [Bacteroidia bacterium]|nr:DNA polymerase III subunit beta [Bacteroidia bacterium]MDW8301063.1 DNA polymerase III subunit beta [Bacteroidia bacterium]